MPSVDNPAPAAPRAGPSHSRIAQAGMWTFAAYVALLPIMQFPWLQWLSPSPILADTAFLVTCGFVLVGLLRKHLVGRTSSFYYPLGFYAIAILLSILLASASNRHLSSVFVEAYVLLIAVLTFNLIRSGNALKLILQAWMVGTAITVLAAMAGIVWFYSGVNRETNIFLSTYGTLVPGDYPRIRGLFLNMNMCCNYLSISFVFLLAMFSIGWIGKRSALWFGGGILIAALFTFSLGLGGLALGACIWMWVRYREHNRVVAARASLLIGALIALAFFAATLVLPASLYNSHSELELKRAQLKPSGRVLCWRDAFDTARQNKWFGKGAGAPVAAVDLLTPSGEQQFLTDAHNTFLSIAAHEGILGLMAFSTLLIFMLRKPNLQTTGSAQAVVHTAAWIGLIQALLYQGIAGSWEHTRHIWILIGLVAALRRNRDSDGQRLASP